jgi:hypothetical protein
LLTGEAGKDDRRCQGGPAFPLPQLIDLLAGRYVAQEDRSISGRFSTRTS